MTTANRASLMRAATLVRPALAARDYIPALTHIQFNRGRVTAFNDISAISVACDNNIDACVPGELLIKALSGFGGDEVMVQMSKDGNLSLKAGHSNIKLPTLAADAFPFDQPNPNEGEIMTLGRATVKAIERCLISVNTNTGHPAQMGVTLDTEEGTAVLYSTDNYTISRCATSDKLKLPGDAPVIMPRFFCEQLISLAKAYPADTLELIIYPGALVVEVGDQAGQGAFLFTKTPVDLEPLDFPRIVSKHVTLKALKKNMQTIPNAFDAALNRAMLVLDGLKTTKVGTGDGILLMTSRSAMGEAEDDMKFDGDALDFTFDPSLISRGAKVCSLMDFTDKVTIMADADCDFIHIIAHRT